MRQEIDMPDNPSKRGPHRLQTAAGEEAITVDTAVGERTLPSHLILGQPLQAPTGAHAERLNPLLQIADAITASVPLSSAAKIRAAVALWQDAIAWFGVSDTNITIAVPIALIVARCCPPVGYPLPPFLRRRVLPVTAAADIDTMRRAATLGVKGMEGSLVALADHRVLALQRAIGGRARKITTSKRPILYHEVSSFWTSSVKAHHEAKKSANVSNTFTTVRDGFAVVLAFSAATRVSELLDLRGEHLQVDEDGVIILTFASVKNRRTLFTTHQPFKIALRLPLLTEAFALFNKYAALLTKLRYFIVSLASLETSCRGTGLRASSNR
jgi:hypothetical protein